MDEKLTDETRELTGWKNVANSWEPESFISVLRSLPIAFPADLCLRLFESVSGGGFIFSSCVIITYRNIRVFKYSLFHLVR